MSVSARAAQVLAQAIQAHRLGHIEDAMGLYRQVLALEPGNATAQATLGMVHAQRGELDLARGLLERAVAARHDDADAWMALGNVRIRQGQAGPAASAFGTAATLQPGLAAAHINLGNTLRRLGRLPEAVEALQRGIALQPTLAAAHFNLGCALTDQDRPDDAVEAFGRALAIDPGYHAARANLGAALLRLDRPADALASFDAVLAGAPGFPKAAYNAGVALQQLGRNDEAAQRFQQALADDPADAEARNNLVVALIRAQRPAEALTECDRYLQTSPAHPKALAYKAVALLELDRRDEAAQLLDYQQLLLRRHVAAPEPFKSIAELNLQLAEQVATHETLRFEPRDKSTYGGSQTTEFLYQASGAAGALRALVIQGVHAYLAHVRAALPAHPFVAALPERWRLASWAVSLRAQGHQGPHFHPDGCISGVYYVAVPDSIREAQGAEGALEFGRTGDAVGGSREPLIELVAPEEGLMVLFPSYFYHRTLPFSGEQSRISVAFDVLPDA